jgi:hypothetical protein
MRSSSTRFTLQDVLDQVGDAVFTPTHVEATCPINSTHKIRIRPGDTVEVRITCESGVCSFRDLLDAIRLRAWRKARESEAAQTKRSALHRQGAALRDRWNR